LGFYTKELKALEKKNILRERKCFSDNSIDCASNDYMGISSNKDILKLAYEKILHSKDHSPKASMLINGYSKIHKEFEENLSLAHKFERCLSLGSGFLANIALIEALVRKGDRLFIDADFHASGIVASKLVRGIVSKFRHNDYLHLEEMLKKDTSHRKIIAIEGIYSMSGDLCKKEFFDIAIKYNCILIIDEAHSSGVVGKNCLGVMDLYDICPHKNYIKMGTLGKAYGSYGAYILANSEIISFLENRAKSVIYSTAISLFDIAFGHEAFLYIQQNSANIQKKIKSIQDMINQNLNIQKPALIFPIEIGDNKKTIDIQKALQKKSILVGAIRTPTVNKAIIRFTMNINNEKQTNNICLSIKEAINA